ncbi:1-aminocyclopropane-1-carboxylate deaminase/D-cysteine desulfhydrase [Frankia sp. AgB32]|uniref:1-aminocyclopropane-1-carboxylate deaminase/D-cysteine desulfhydrase n=1 Tax=Frankia sp. AgB32 TaxID=631119 RepID=UPI00200E0852|nr:pyridoxal-phosphate dependent enzyme [Frankia sp. AgB32]MCK9896540.1 pyridoxal-phosphate dependent enzyme [Frankia sp. AgB32]
MCARAGDVSLAGAVGRLPSPLVETVDDRLAARGVRLLLKRDDLIHPDIPGNKWRKLGPNLARARQLGQHTVLTFGGAYSNHVRALAAAGSLLGLRTVGVIRGEEHRPLNPVLRFAADAGMRLTYLDRASYRAVRAGTGAAVLAGLTAEFGPFHLLPEGGSNTLGVRGCAGLPAELDQDFDVLCCSCGTGGTLAGLAAGLAPGRRALGVTVLRGAAFLDADVARLQQAAFGVNSGNWTLTHDFHAGGYARTTPELTRFLADFHDRHGLALDAVYEGKLLHGLFSLVAAGAFAPGETLVAVVNALADGPPARVAG